MLKFLLLIAFIFAPAAVLPDDPKTPSEALKIANETIQKWRAAGDKSRAAREKAFQTRAALAKSLTPLFKIETLAGEELLAFGTLAALAAEHGTAEKAFAAYLGDARAADPAAARQGLFRALTQQQKTLDAVPVAEQIVDETADVGLLTEIDAALQPLKVQSPAAAKKLARRITAKMVANGGLKVSEAETAFAAIALVNSLQTAVFADDLRAAPDDREYLARFLEKFKTTALAENQTLKTEVEAVARRFDLIGKPAPKIAAIDVVGDAKPPGNPPDKLVVLDFLAHWCVACLDAFPLYDRLRAKYQSKGLEIVGVTRFYGYFGARAELAPAAEKTEVARLRETHAVKYGFLFTNQSTETAFGVVGLPAVVVIDRRGVVRFARQGDVSAAELEKIIERLLAE